MPKEEIKYGEYFCQEDSPGDVGIYRVRFIGEDSMPLYVKSLSDIESARIECDRLNSN